MDTIRLPYKFCFGLLFALRGIIAYVPQEGQVAYWIRLAGLMFFFWDIVHIVWHLDFPFTFSLVGQPVMDDKQNKV